MPWLDRLLTVDWGTLGKTAISALVGAGLGSALVQGAFSFIAEKRQRAAHATYLAMRIAVLLDAFEAACSELINSNASAQRYPDERLPEWDIHLPELPPYPEDTEGWVSLDRALASRCLELRSQICARQKVIDATREYDDESLGEMVAKEAADLGLEASRLASGLRRKYRLCPAEDEYAASSEVEKRKRRRSGR
jgi:hypothetical protein